MDAVSAAKQAIDTWHLGKTSAKHESGGRGAEVISTGKGDYGGASYGIYQLSSKTGTLLEYLKQCRYGQRFDGLRPDSLEFNAKWRAIAKSDPGFGQDQHQFIKRTHYDIQSERLKASGLDLTSRGRAVHDALWSTSVQFRHKTKNIFLLGIEERFGPNIDPSLLSDREIVEAVQEYKIAHNKALFKSSARAWPGLLRRANEERAELTLLAEYEKLLARRGLSSDWRLNSTSRNVQSQGDDRGGSAVRMKASPSAPPLPDPGRDSVRTLQQNLSRLGVTDGHNLALAVDGLYGTNTRAAVSEFQHAQGLPATGIADNRTLSALQAHVIVADLQHRKAEREAHAQAYDAGSINAAVAWVDPALPARVDPVIASRETAWLHASLHPERDSDAPRATYAAQPPTQAVRQAEAGAIEPTTRRAVDMPDHSMGLARAPVMPSAPRAKLPTPMPPQASHLRPFSDPHHPQHALYAELKAALPDYVSEDRLAQFTAACHKSGINAGNLHMIDINTRRICFIPRQVPASIAEVSLTQDPPAVQQTMQEMEAYDQQRMQRLQFHAQQRQQHGPVLG
jgi:hypothetical protein